MMKTKLRRRTDRVGIRRLPHLPRSQRSLPYRLKNRILRLSDLEHGKVFALQQKRTHAFSSEDGAEVEFVPAENYELKTDENGDQYLIMESGEKVYFSSAEASE